MMWYWHQYLQSLRDMVSIDNTAELIQYHVQHISRFATRNYNYNVKLSPIPDAFLSDITMKAVRNEYQHEDDKEWQEDEISEENKGHKLLARFDHSFLSDETSDDSGSQIDRNIKDYSWNNRFQELIEFVKENGHCNVPKNYFKNEALGLWLARQREQYRLRYKNDHSFITTSRLRALESISKEWYTPYEQSTKNKCSKVSFEGAEKTSEEQEVEDEAKQQSSVKDEMENTGDSKPNGDDEAELNISWHKRFKDLLEFQKNFGHCNVPRRYAPNKTLGNWVNKQRCLYRKFYCEGKTSPLSQYRVDTLNDVGFLWNIRKLSKRGGNSDN